MMYGDVRWRRKFEFTIFFKTWGFEVHSMPEKSIFLFRAQMSGNPFFEQIPVFSKTRILNF